MFSIFKTDDDKRLVFGWASISITIDGEQIEDRQQDIIDPEDLEEAAYEYVLNFRDTGEEHIPTMRKKGKLVESCVFTEEKQKAMGLPEGSLPIGWWIGFKIDDDAAWERVKNGTYRMFSIEGKASREPVEKSMEKDDRPTGCGVLVIQDGKILTGTRIEQSSRGKICGPGGHIEEGETPEEAAVREAYEEFGINCKEMVPLGIQDGGEKYGKSAIFMCSKFSGTPRTDEEEMTDVQWMDPEEIDDSGTFPPFWQSLKLLPSEKRDVAKTFDEVLKFNPFHDAAGKFSSSQGFKTYSANPKTKAGAMAISRSAQAGHGTTFNVHRESKGENVNQNYAWLNGGPGAKTLSSMGQLASQQPKKPQVNVDSKGFKDFDSADFHDLYNGSGYYKQQQLDQTAKQSCASYLNPYPEAGSLYNFSQNMNYAVQTGGYVAPKYQKVFDNLKQNMHNIGYNVNLTRYDHGGFLDDRLAAAGINGGHKGMSVAKMKSALVGQTYGDKRIISTSYNNFKNAADPSTFTTREVKITYKAKAGAQALMPGDGPGGKFGEMLLAPTGTNGSKNNQYKIVDVKLSGNKARPKGGSKYNLSLNQIEIVVEVG